MHSSPGITRDTSNRLTRIADTAAVQLGKAHPADARSLDDAEERVSMGSDGRWYVHHRASAKENWLAVKRGLSKIPTTARGWAESFTEPAHRQAPLGPRLGGDLALGLATLPLGACYLAIKFGFAAADSIQALTHLVLEQTSGRLPAGVTLEPVEAYSHRVESSIGGNFILPF